MKRNLLILLVLSFFLTGCFTHVRFVPDNYVYTERVHVVYSWYYWDGYYWHYYPYHYRNHPHWKNYKWKSETHKKRPTYKPRIERPVRKPRTEQPKYRATPKVERKTPQRKRPIEKINRPKVKSSSRAIKKEVRHQR